MIYIYYIVLYYTYTSTYYIVYPDIYRPIYTIHTVNGLSGSMWKLKTGAKQRGSSEGQTRQTVSHPCAEMGKVWMVHAYSDCASRGHAEGRQASRGRCCSRAARHDHTHQVGFQWHETKGHRASRWRGARWYAETYRKQLDRQHGRQR